jgi:hypothetical protein
MCLFKSSTCFELLCAHPHEDNCINTTSGKITVLVAVWYARAYRTYQMLYYTIVLLRMSTEWL